MADVSEHATNRNPGRLTNTERAKYGEEKPAQNSACDVFEGSLVCEVQMLEETIALASTMRTTTEDFSDHEESRRSRSSTVRSCVASKISLRLVDPDSWCSLLHLSLIRTNGSQKEGR
jgi:hypothetical protein